MSKIADAGKVRGALEAIERALAGGGDELRERTAQFLAGELPAAEVEMGRTAIGGGTTQVALRVPDKILGAVDALVLRLRAVGFGDMSRSSVLRAALEKGVAVLTRELPAAPPGRKVKRETKKSSKKRG